MLSLNGEYSHFENVSSGFNYDDVNTIVTVYGKDRLPYVAPVYFQNDSVVNKKYRFVVNEISIGSEVTSNREFGNFIYSGGKLTIDARKTVILTDGFIIDNNADVIINSEYPVYIKGGIVKNGSTLTINARTLRISKNFSTENGGKVILNRNL